MTFLKTAALARGIRAGVGMRNWSVFTGTPGLQTLCANHFRLLMPGNAFKWINTEPQQGVFDLTEAAQFVDWADAQAISTRIHTLVWHTSLPSWVAPALNVGTWQGIIDTHIQGVLQDDAVAFRSMQVDVVNEAFQTADGLPGGFRNNIFYQAAGGSDYIPYAFQRARVHNPGAQLFLSDFGLDQSDGAVKRQNVLIALSGWLDQLVPIDGLALHAHLKPGITPGVASLQEFITDVQALGLEVIVSEFDFREIANLHMTDEAAFAYLKEYTRTFINAVADVGVATVISWGASPEDWAGTSTEQIAAVPFGVSPNFAPTPIFDGMIQAYLQEEVETTVARSNYDVAIGYDNRIDTSLLTVTNQVNTLLVDNLKSTNIHNIWRAASNTVAIRADFGSDIMFGGTALINSNAVPGDTMRVGLSTTDATGLTRDAYDSGTISSSVDPAFGMLVHFPPAPVLGRHLRIDLTQANPPEAGRWFAGPVWFTTRAFSYGWRPLWRDPSRRSESLGQTIHIDRKFRQRGFGFTLTGITEAEADDHLHELNRLNGTSRDILVCRNLLASNLGKNTIWGLAETPPPGRQDHPDFYTVDFEVYERL